MATRKNTKSTPAPQSAACSPSTALIHRKRAVDRVRRAFPFFHRIRQEDAHGLSGVLSMARGGTCLSAAETLAKRILERAVNAYETCQGPRSLVLDHLAAADVAEAAVLCCAPTIDFVNLKEALASARK